MSTETGVQERIAALFAGGLNLAIPSSTTDLFETGALDSMAFVELLVLIEHEFGVVVPLEDIAIDNFRSIATIAQVVEARAGAGGNGSSAAPAGEPRVPGRTSG